MKSKIVSALKLKYLPFTIIHTNSKPDNAVEFKTGKWGCVIWMMAKAAKGATVVFDKHGGGCKTGLTSMGFGNQTKDAYPFDLDCYYHFLSYGNEKWEKGRKEAEKLGDAIKKGTVPHDFYQKFLEGKRFKKNPEIAQKAFESLPIVDIKEKFVVFKPLEETDLQSEKIQSVVFLVDAFNFNVLNFLGNYDNWKGNRTVAQQAAGCQVIGILTYNENQSEDPKIHTMGIPDLMEPKKERDNLIDQNLMIFSIPYHLFQKMEEWVDESFLNKPSFRKIQELD